MPGSRGVAIIGVGNAFRRDDGVGPAVVARLAQHHMAHRPPEDVTLSSSDGDPARLMALWEGRALAVIVDAVRVDGGRPGRIRRWEPRTCPGRLPVTASTHGLGVREAVELSEALDGLPARTVVWAVEVVDVGPGPGLSPPVAAAVVGVADAVDAHVRRFLDAHGSARAAQPGPSACRLDR
ncbi:hydrogenase maturation protease [Streptomyces sp. NPDC047315]|uniref:hydrogenase maturation protease n=1 Tax=Streptomyces sp. NPDC047315 TaxID=3155142 RepID=UPI0034101668